MSRGTKTKSRQKKPSATREEESVAPARRKEAVETNQPWWRQEWTLGALLMLLTLLAYQPVWHAGFIWDDDEMVTENPLVKSIGGLYRLWFTASTPDYYPLTSSMFLLEWHLWGDHALGYHVVNVLLHAASAVLWWQILRLLKIPGAWLAAAIFAVHPVNVESVAWIAEGKNTLAMLFFAGTLWCWLKFEDDADVLWHRLALTAFVLALLSKTAVSPLPVVLLALAWWRRGRIERRDILRTIPFFIASAVLALVTIWFQAHKAIGHEIVRTDSLVSRLAGAGCAVWFYLYKAIVPFHLAFIYSRWPIDPGNIWWCVPLLLLAAAFAWFWRKRNSWGKPWLFALGYFVAMLLPILGFINVYFMRYSLVADHWQYFAIIAPIAMVAAGINMRAGLEYVIGGPLVFILAVLTWNQCGIYTDAATLWRTTEEQNPNAAPACINLGQILMKNGDAAAAIPQFERALEIDSNNADAQNNLGFALAAGGRIPEAIAHYEKAAALDPDAAEFHNNLGTVLTKAGRTDEAIAEFQKSLSLKPDSAEMHANLGALFDQAGRKDEAAAQFQAAMQLRPAYAQDHFNLGLDCAQRGQMNEAAAHFRLATQLQPDFLEGYINLGNSLMGQWKLSDAVIEFKKALAIAPNNVEAENDLAVILATAADSSLRSGAEAVRLAEQANQTESGKNPRVLLTLASAYAEVEKFPDAVATAEHGLQIAEAQANSELAETLQARLKLYRANQPFHGLERPH